MQEICRRWKVTTTINVFNIINEFFICNQITQLPIAGSNLQGPIIDIIYIDVVILFWFFSFLDFFFRINLKP